MMAVPSMKAKLAPKMARHMDQRGIATCFEPKMTTEKEDEITASLNIGKLVINNESVNDNEQNTTQVKKENLSETNELSRKLRRPTKLTVPRPMKVKTPLQSVPDSPPRSLHDVPDFPPQSLSTVPVSGLVPE